MAEVTDLAEYRRRKRVEKAVAELRRDTGYWDAMWTLLRSTDMGYTLELSRLRDGPEPPAA